MTVGVYGLVAGIVKLDDVGLHLVREAGEGARARMRRRLGRAVLVAAPLLMKGLAVVGTAAMFLVGGGHRGDGIPPRAHPHAGRGPDVGGVGGGALGVLLPGVVGLVAGAILVVAVMFGKRVGPRRTPREPASPN